MPKEVQKITNFTGGLNSSTDPQDIAPDEVATSINLDSSQRGRVRQVGRVRTDISPLNSKTTDIDVDTQVIAFMHRNRSAECVKISLFQDPTSWATVNYYHSTGPVLVANGANPTTATAVGILMKESGVNTGGGTGGDNSVGYIVVWMIKGDFDGTDGSEDDIFLSPVTNGDIYTMVTTSATSFTDTGADVFVRHYQDGSSITMNPNTYGTALANYPKPPVYEEGGVRSFDISDKGFDFIFFENSTPTAQMDRFVRQFNWWDENVQGIKDTSGTSLNNANCQASFQVKEALVLCDSGFHRPLYKMQWINDDYFQTGADNKSLFVNKRFIYETVDCPKLTDLGIGLSLHNSNAENPDSSDVTTGDKVILSFWTHKDDTGLNTFLGGWKGEYAFGIAGLYDGDQKNLGRIQVIGTSQAFDNDALNFQVYVSLKATGTPNSLLDHGTGGSDATAYNLNQSNQKPFANTDRLTGLRFFFKPTSQDDWFNLLDCDLLKGKDEFWTVQDADVVKGYGMPLGSCTINHDITAETGSCEFGYFNSSLCATVAYTITNLDGWAGRAGFIRARGYYIDPVYITVGNIVAGESTTTATHGIPATNPSPGVHQLYAELVDENYQQLLKSPNQSVTYIDGGIGIPIVVPEQDPSSTTVPSCYVADVLYGKDNIKTYQARFYASNKFSKFYSMYRKYGKSWAEFIKKYTWIKPIVRPFWDRMVEKGSVYFNKPTGIKNLRTVLNKLECTFPNIFEYYLVGSHARNEELPLDYKIQVVPLIDKYSDRKFYYRACEEVLKELTYQDGKRLQEEDGRCIYPEILMEFEDVVKEDKIENSYKVERWIYKDKNSKYELPNAKRIGKNMYKIYGDLYTEYELYRGIGNMKYTARIL